jgi:ssDNA-binding Zn-finger/Zn-ribbon topoisomerase 1
MNLGTVIAIITFVVIGVIIVVGALLSRGKQLRCPDCEHVFNAPIMEEKWSGLGWTLPYMGIIRCTKCGNKRSRRDYNKVEQQQTKESKKQDTPTKRPKTKMVR